MSNTYLLTMLVVGGGSLSGDRSLTEHLFRTCYGEILAALLRSIGYNNFELAEEAVQTAFQRALEKWPFSGVPGNPAGWLYAVARNAALEALRRAKLGDLKLQQLHAGQELAGATPVADEATALDRGLDDLATMILLCCNPALKHKAQVCLTLQAACGFSIREIARALGMSEEAVKKTVSRAKENVAQDPAVLRELNSARIAERFPCVLDALYAMFNEGYAASCGDSQLRREVAEEAIRLSHLIRSSNLVPDIRRGELHALLALMLLQLARFGARIGEQGIPVRLQEQDRGKWDVDMIRAGMAALEASLVADRPTVYHLEARIAAEHSTSPSFDATNWNTILALYDQLLALKDSPQVRLNRIVALRYACGAEVAWREFENDSSSAAESLAGSPAESFFSRAVRADLLEALGRPAEAIAEWQKALESSPTGADKAFLECKLKKLSIFVPGH